MSSSATYFVAATIVTAGPTSARIRSRFARTASGDTGDLAPWTPRGLPVRRCEKKRSGLQHVQTSVRSVVPPGGRRSARSAALQRSSLWPRTTSAPNVDAKGSDTSSPHLVTTRTDRRADGGGRSRPPSVSAPTRTIPASSPPACRTATAASPPVRASAIGRQSAVIARIGCSVVRPEAVAGLTPRAPLGAVHECRVHLPVEREPLGVGPIAAHSSRRFSSTRSTSSPVIRPRLSDAYGPR